jgi:radical SAM superfamily enzyme YgiQ (UPF0313 family)
MDTAWKTRMSPPLALLTVGALTPTEHDVHLADENVERIAHDDGWPELVGITVKADTFYRSAEIAAAYRSRGARVAMGGIHPTACPGECAPFCDAVVIGEAEILWPRLLADAAAGNLQPLYRNAGPVDPALTPVPRWDLLRERNYLFTNTLCAGRGCPWRCEFCYNSSRNLDARYRMKPVDYIVAEIESLGIAHAMFIDDNFIGDPARAADLADRLGRMGITWHAAVSADLLRHGDLLDRMAASGCRSLFIGFETLNPDALRGCRKVQNRVEDYEALVDAIHARDMMVNASVVFGFDEDSPGVFDATVDWLERRRVATMTAHILTPYPGTRLHARLEREGRLLTRDLCRYNTSCAVFKPAGMTAGELERGYRGAYDRFYSWTSMWRRRPVSPTQRVAFWEFNLLYRKFGAVTSWAGRVLGMRAMAKLAKRLAYPARRQRGARLPCPTAGAMRES